ncbi:nitrilase-related carbon-nitrogen hydrolase [Amycolatopsis aidingensis]|uniref:nitrilase-related carbon-nitrogen hydrolase n=1 Tax=Amycolatopsis aidingensis TaxID=2842453 RepID=UPI0038CC101B
MPAKRSARHDPATERVCPPRARVCPLRARVGRPHPRVGRSRACVDCRCPRNIPVPRGLPPGDDGRYGGRQGGYLSVSGQRGYPAQPRPYRAPAAGGHPPCSRCGSRVAALGDPRLGASARRGGTNRTAACTSSTKPGDLVERYDKRFCAGDPDGRTGDLAHYSPGDHPSTWEINGLRCGALICYDYRYPELYREYAKAGVRLMFHSFQVANPRR